MQPEAWRLPGPATLVDEAVQQVRRRRHVAVALPDAMAADVDVVDALTEALWRELSETSEVIRVRDLAGGPSLVAAIGELTCDDDPPVTVPDLLEHPSSQGVVWAVAAVDLTPQQRPQLAALLAAVATASKSRSRGQPPVLLVVGSLTDLHGPGGHPTDEPTTATVWWWGRVSRWDTGAVVSAAASSPAAPWASPGSSPRSAPVIDDARLEVVIEVARWDLALARALALAWDGDPASLTQHLPAAAGGPGTDLGAGAGTGRSGPPPQALARWTGGDVDLWHGEPCHRRDDLLARPTAPGGLVWRAQARVFLPWVESRRAQLEVRLRAAAPRQQVERLCGQENVDPAGPIEVNPLRRMVQAVLRSDDALCRAVKELSWARNRLAHLDPLSLADQHRLVASCAGLT